MRMRSSMRRARTIVDAGLALVARAGAGDRARGQRRVAARGSALFHDRHRCPRVVSGDRGRKPAGAGADDEDVDVWGHDSQGPIFAGRGGAAAQLGCATIAATSSAQRFGDVARPERPLAMAG